MSVWPPCCDVLQHVGCCWLNSITHDIATLLAQNLQAPAKQLQHFDQLNISQLCWAQHVACVWPICCDQEIIKVREWIPHIGPLTKVIRLKIFLDIVPSSSEDITRAMRGQPKRLSRNYQRKNGGNVISYVLVSFRFVSALSVAFLCSRAFRLFFCSFGCSLFCRLFGFRELN